MAKDVDSALSRTLDQALAHLRAGRPADAMALMADVLATDPDNPHAHYLAGMARLHDGAAGEAAGHLGRAVEGAPDAAEYHVNYAVALHRLGRLDDAIGHGRRALALDTRSVAALTNLGFAYRDAGAFAEALDAFARALALDAGHTGAQLGYAEVLGGLRAPAYDPALADALVQGLAFAKANPADLGPAAAHQLALKYGAAPDTAADPDDARAAEAAEAIADDALFAAYLERCVNTDAALERLLTAVRRRLLLAGPDGLSAGALATAAVLARQCFTNEYVFHADDAEAAALDRLRADLESLIAEGGTGDAGFPARALLYALYAPLGGLAGAEALAQADPGALGPALAALVQITVRDRIEEAALMDTIETTGDVTDATSVAVRAQYEESPYPRWRHAPDQQPGTIAAKLAALFPHAPPPVTEMPPRILIAGCGTGQHAAHVARSHPDAHILAIDLSKASIAYAMRMMGVLGIANVRFMQCDILGAGALDGGFDMIQSVGVLHHMKEPLAGGRVLAGLLRPGGVMKLGLYSARGRAAVRVCRQRIAREGLSASAADIVRFRRRLMTEPPKGDVEGDAAAVLGTADFYTTSMCRDLLFHVHEAHTTPKQIKAELDALGLDFIGFEMFEDSGINDAYRESFPDDPALADLDNWEALEDSHGGLIDMYVLWCRKPHGGPAK